MDIDGGHQNLLPYVIVLALELTAGTFFNAFIISVIFYDFYKEKNMIDSNKIVMCICISNVIYNVLTAAGIMDDCVGLHSSLTFDLSYLYMILVLYNISSCGWLSAGLGVFYFVMISQAKLLAWVKFRISSIVPWMLLILEVVSFINSLSSSLLLIFPRIRSRNITESTPSIMQVLAENKAGLINAAVANTSMPIVIILISTICTILTLKQHSLKMKRGMETVDQRCLTPFERVVCRMTYFLLFYLAFYSLVLNFYFSIVSQVESGFWVTLMLMSSFTPVQSMLLILGNPRFKDVWKEMLCYQKLVKLLRGSNDGRM
ncbi:taste receptor type 2 member 39-like [Anomaloglossus baeobatrachus]|uniref:taste receptor type 2 member 39-like n=1 Tax=Anomaloglossus baeobatrachus TaxID=238106 RepID=UPI003F4F72DB